LNFSVIRKKKSLSDSGSLLCFSLPSDWQLSRWD